MTSIVTTGLHGDWCDFAQQRLKSMGIVNAEQGSQFQLTPHQLLDRMCANYSRSLHDVASIEPTPAGTTWHVSAADIFMANAFNKNWGWADPRNLFFLDFWKDFDPQCKFVLIYGGLEDSLALRLKTTDDSQFDYNRHLRLWSRYHEEMLRFHQSAPDRSLLIHIDAFDDNASEVSGQLNERFDLPANKLNDSSVFNSAPILNLISSEYVRSNGGDEMLRNELESSADVATEDRQTKSAKLTQLARYEYDQSQEKIESIATTEQISESLQVQVTALLTDLERANQVITELSQDNSSQELEKENELLKAQLSQVQQELALYFKERLEHSENDVPATPAQSDVTNVDGPVDAEIVIDLTLLVSGRGWHAAETLGRWAGENPLEATLDVPKLVAGKYRMEARVVDSASLRHLLQSEWSMGDAVIRTTSHLLSDVGGRLAPLRRLKAKLMKTEKAYPASVIGHVQVDHTMAKKGGHTLKIRYPAAVSPAQRGGVDSRPLALCVSRVEFSRIA